MEVIIVSGLSGAGKSVALRQLEDLGYYCIDNLPLDLLGPLAKRAWGVAEGRFDRIALGIDARDSGDAIRGLPQYMDRLRERGLNARILFLTADEDALLKRFAETRRKHPLSGSQYTLLEAVQKERALLEPIASYADEIIDTSSMNLHELRERILLTSRGEEAPMLLSIVSFGFKNGMPDGLDFVFDVRCLPNPHWKEQLRAHSGQDQEVVEWLAGHDSVVSMIDDIDGFLQRWLPAFDRQARSYITVGVGCTGGQHRSVYIAEQLAQRLRALYPDLQLRHKELAA